MWKMWSFWTPPWAVTGELGLLQESFYIILIYSIVINNLNDYSLLILLIKNNNRVSLL